MMASLVEYYHLVLFRTSTELFTTALAEAFNQHVEFLAFVFLVLLGRNLRLQGDKLVKATDLFLFGNIVGQVF